MQVCGLGFWLWLSWGLMAICLGLGGFPGAWFGFWGGFVVVLVWLGLIDVGWVGADSGVVGNVVVTIGLGGSCF